VAKIRGFSKYSSLVSQNADSASNSNLNTNRSRGRLKLKTEKVLGVAARFKIKRTSGTRGESADERKDCFQDTKTFVTKMRTEKLEEFPASDEKNRLWGKTALHSAQVSSQAIFHHDNRMNDLSNDILNLNPQQSAASIHEPSTSCS